MRRTWPLGLAAVVLLTACTGGQPVARTSAPPPPTTASPSSPPSRGPNDIDCDHSIASLPTPSPGTRVYLGVVALPNRVLQAVRDQEGWLWAKQGLEVLAGSTVELTLTPAVRDHAWIGWGSPARRSPTQRLANCARPGCAHDCGWLAFAGGYWVERPMCLPIVVRSGDRESTARVPVGAACD
jgi:hypothetical protein